MSASFPTSVKSFTTKVDGVDPNAAADVNALQDEVTALESDLLNGVAFDLLPDGDLTRKLGSAAKRWDGSKIGSLSAANISAGLLAQARGGTNLDTSAATDGQILIGKTSDHSLNLAAITAGAGISVTNGGGAITIAATSANAISIYAATLTNVISTNAITTFLSATIANAIASGDIIRIVFDALIKQNTGGGAIGTLTITLGGQSLAITLPSWSDSATEWEERLVIELQCVGANVKVLDYLGVVNVANTPETLLFGDITGRAMNNVATITGPTLTAGQTLLLRLTPASSSANYYLKPQAGCVMHFRN